MFDVLINCSLSNATAVVFVHADDYRIYQESDGERNCVGLWHPDGKPATDQWKKDHPMLANHLLREAGVFSPQQEEEFQEVRSGIEVDLGSKGANEELINALEKGEVFSQGEGKEIVVEVSDAIVADEAPEAEPGISKVELNAEETDTDSVVVGSDGAVANVPDQEDSPVETEEEKPSDGDSGVNNTDREESKADEDFENLVSLGLPDSCLDELRGAGLFTKEAILAFEDLSSIKGIGVKTREKILTILKGA